MIINRTIILTSDDIFDAIKLYLNEKCVCLPEEVCMFSLLKADSSTNDKIAVQLSDKEVK